MVKVLITGAAGQVGSELVKLAPADFEVVGYNSSELDITNAQQNLLDAENDWYNIAKQQVTDVTGEIVSTWQECQDKIKDIYSDMTLTDEERSA